MNVDNATRWTAADFAPPPPPPPPEPTPTKVGPSVEELAAIERAAREEGLSSGRAEGFAQGQAEVERLRAQLQVLLNGFTRPLAELDAEIADALGVVAVRVAGALLGRSYAADPVLLAELVHTALGELEDERRDAQVHLNPHDHALLQKQLQGVDARLIADSSLKRGDVRVHTPTLRIDASLQARLDAALAALQRSES